MSDERKTPKDRDTKDLLELCFQLNARTAMQPGNKFMHDAYWEARKELEYRVFPSSLTQETAQRNLTKEESEALEVVFKNSLTDKPTRKNRITQETKTEEVDLLDECRLQLEYLNEKFGETGTTNSLLSRISNRASSSPDKKPLREWISVEERLPEIVEPNKYDGYEITEEVYAVRDGQKAIGWFQIYTRDNETWGVKKGDVKFKCFGNQLTPTHWTTLPVFYPKPEGSDNG